MNKLNINAIAIAMAFGLSACSIVNSMPEEYISGKDAIATVYESAKTACGSLSGNAKDTCQVEASDKDRVGEAELNAKYKPSMEANFEVGIARADADYSVARDKCNDKAGNGKDVCVKEAKATAVATKADAKVQMKIAKANQNASESPFRASNKAREQNICDSSGPSCLIGEVH